MKKLAAPLMLLGLIVATAFAGNQEIKTYMIFNGSNVADSTERRSFTIPVRGANRVILRFWTAGTAAYTAADSEFADSARAFKVLFSDSVSFIGRDSSGAIVTARSTQTNTNAFPICADSVMITTIGTTMGAASSVDTTFKLIGVANAPLNDPLRAAVTGSGIYTYVVPLAPSSVGTYGDGGFGPQYMWIRITPYTRMTLGGVLSTAGIRTRGFNRLRCEAQVIFQNR